MNPEELYASGGPIDSKIAEIVEQVADDYTDESWLRVELNELVLAAYEEFKQKPPLANP